MNPDANTLVAAVTFGKGKFFFFFLKALGGNFGVNTGQEGFEHTRN